MLGSENNTPDHLKSRQTDKEATAAIAAALPSVANQVQAAVYPIYLSWCIPFATLKDDKDNNDLITWVQQQSVVVLQ